MRELKAHSVQREEGKGMEGKRRKGEREGRKEGSEEREGEK